MPTNKLNSRQTVLWSNDLCLRWNVSPVTLWRWRRNNKIPPPDFQTHRPAWNLKTIQQYEDRNAASIERTYSIDLLKQ